MQIFILMTYIDAGYSKAIGTDWWTDCFQFIDFFDRWAEASRVSTTNSCGNTRRDAQLFRHYRAANTS